MDWRCLGIATLQVFGMIIGVLLGLFILAYICYLIEEYAVNRIPKRVRQMFTIPRKVREVLIAAFTILSVAALLSLWIAITYQEVCK